MDKRPTFSRRSLTFLCCVFAIPTATKLIPGIRAEQLLQAVLAGALLGLAYLLIRPILRILTIPIGCLTLGAFSYVIDIALIWVLPIIIRGFFVDSLLDAALAALLVNGVCLIVGGIR